MTPTVRQAFGTAVKTSGVSAPEAQPDHDQDRGRCVLCGKVHRRDSVIGDRHAAAASRPTIGARP